MSISLMSLAFKAELPSSKKLVLLVLCDHADDMGDNVYPSINMIAQKSSLSSRQAQRVMAELLEDGFLSIVGNENGGAPGTTRHYKINIKKLETGDICDTRRVTPAMETGDTGDTGDAHDTGDNMSRVTPMTQTGDICDTRRVTPMSPKPPILTITNHQEVVSGAPPAATRPPPSPKDLKSPPDFLGEDNDAEIPERAIVKISPNWELPEEWGIYAEKLGFQPNEIICEAEKFKDYWVNGKGKGKRRSKRGWRTAWSNWLGKSQNFRR